MKWTVLANDSKSLGVLNFEKQDCENLALLLTSFVCLYFLTVILGINASTTCRI